MNANAFTVAVLSYHGWEVDPEHVMDDVCTLRNNGWIDVSLEKLHDLLSGGDSTGGRFFHVTFDDGAESDRDMVRALRTLSCPSTYFISLEAMTDAALAAYQEILSSGDVRIEDHSLRHRRVFHYRHVVGFHCNNKTIISSPERLNLQYGSPVCMFGGELVKPKFEPSREAIDVCNKAALSAAEPEGSAEWNAAIAGCLLESGYGFYRFGKLCIQGDYESGRSFAERIATYLREGNDRLQAFTQKRPLAFAYPWWQAGPVAEKYLRNLGYRMTFSGQGLCQQRNPYGIPRIFVNNHTQRPLRPELVTRERSRMAINRHLRSLGRQIVYR